MLSKGTTTTDYRNAPSNSGPLAAQWIDKPHRLIYDLCGEVERLWRILASQLCSCGLRHETDTARHAEDCRYRAALAGEENK